MLTAGEKRELKAFLGSLQRTPDPAYFWIFEHMFAGDVYECVCGVCVFVIDR